MAIILGFGTEYNPPFMVQALKCPQVDDRGTSSTRPSCILTPSRACMAKTRKVTFS
jgi:hypothetical protein